MSSLKVVTSSKYNRDIKRAKLRRLKLEELEYVLELLVQGKNLPMRYQDHLLDGTYKPFRECHIKPDWLLIYRRTHTHVYLHRTGSHTDLFD